MPIKGLTDRESAFPRLGVLRKGAAKQGNKPGSDLKYFRFDTQDADAARAFREAYGDEPNHIRVYLPYPTVAQNFQTWKEEWAASSLIRRCDGCNITVQRDGVGYTRKPSPCVAPKCACKPVGRLAVIVQELKRLSFVEVQTTSIHDIIELTRNLEAIEGLRGDLRGIPFILSRKPRMISTPGQDGNRVRREKWLLSIEPAPDWVKLQLTAMQQAALPMEAPLELPAPMDDDEDDAPQIVESPRVVQTQPAPDPVVAAAAQNGGVVRPAQPDPLATVRATLERTKAALAAGTGYPAIADALKRYNQLRDIATGDSRIDGDVITLTTLDAKPHITAVMHAIKALCEAIIAANEAQSVPPAAGEQAELLPQSPLEAMPA